MLSKKAQTDNKLRINIGCGQKPTAGWVNFDNSLGLRLSKIPLLTEVLHRLGVINESHIQYIKFARENGVQYGDATNGLPVLQDSCDVIYSAHMIEHLDRHGADRFLKEALRVLCPGGIIRIAVPDIKKQVAKYKESGDANAFIKSTRLCAPRPTTLTQKVRFLLVGPRHHQWMYDGDSLSKLLRKHGFVDVEMMPVGRTNIPDHAPLNLAERRFESVYVEARKPGP